MGTNNVTGIEALLNEVGVEVTNSQRASNEICHNPMEIYLSYLADILVTLTDCPYQVAYDSIQWPNEIGDLAVILPRLRLKDVDTRTLAGTLVQAFPSSPLFAHPFEDGVHLRIFFTYPILARILLPYILDRGHNYGRDSPICSGQPEMSENCKKNVIVEFSSPNLGNGFDLMHLRSTIVGTYVASLYEAMGWSVHKMSFLGDWGKHIGLLVMAWSRFGSDEQFEADPLGHLLEIYCKMNELFKAEQVAIKSASAATTDEVAEVTPAEAEENKSIGTERDETFKGMEDGDQDMISMWKRFRERCIAKYIDQFARLNIKFDQYSGESEVSHETIAEIESALKEKGIYEEDGEAWVVDFKKHNAKHLDTGIMRYRTGTTSYLLRDVAAALERSRAIPFSKMIYVVSARQDTHFLQLFKILELVGHADLAERLQHVHFGRAEGISPTPGRGGLLLGDVLDQYQQAVENSLSAENFEWLQAEETSTQLVDVLGVTALMCQDLSVKRASNVKFDVGKIVSEVEYTGMHLQEWVTKLNQRLATWTLNREELVAADYRMFAEEAFSNVIRTLVQFPGVVRSSFKNLEPSIILAYLFRLIDMLDAAWNWEASVVDSDCGEAQAEPSKDMAVELALYESVRLVLESGMIIIGLTPLSHARRAV